MDAAPTSTTALPPPLPEPSAAPDWSAQDEDLLCPLCDYNLRGLTDPHPRCPECGYHFEWAQLRDERLKLHPYLFEHHPERNAWSFRRTAVAGLLPGRFWKQLHPAQPSRPRRLVKYWCAAMGLTFIAGVLGPTMVAGVLINAARRDAVRRPQVIVVNGVVQYWTNTGMTTTPPTPPGYFKIEGFQEALDDVTVPHAIWWATAGVWPWATIGALLIFRISMRRAKIRPAHVRRCVLYSFDACMWVGVTVLGISVFAFALWLAGNPPGFLHVANAWCLPLLWIVVTYRVGCAYRDYLRFRHPFATVWLAQMVVALAVIVAVGSVGAILDPR